MPTITPFLWFDTQAEEAMNLYTSIFKNSKVIAVNRAGGRVMSVEFELEGQRFMGLNAGPKYKFNEAVSFFISVDTQAEIDDDLGQAAGRRRSARSLRLAEGQVRSVVAGHPEGAAAVALQQRPRQGQEGDGRDDDDEQDSTSRRYREHTTVNKICHRGTETRRRPILQNASAAVRAVCWYFQEMVFSEFSVSSVAVYSAGSRSQTRPRIADSMKAPTALPVIVITPSSGVMPAAVDQRRGGIGDADHLE